MRRKIKRFYFVNMSTMTIGGLLSNWIAEKHVVMAVLGNR